jgi:hypothetical protein
MVRNKAIGEAMLAMAGTAPPLLLRLGVSYLRYKRQAKRAGRSFFHSLVANGIPEKEARDLADDYMTSFSVKKIIRQLGFSMPVSKPK